MFFCESIIKNCNVRAYGFWVSVITIMVLSVGIAFGAQVVTVDDKYPGLASGVLGSAKLDALDEDTLLTADGLMINKTELMETVNAQEPKLHRQLEKNLLFVLEQEVTRRVLVNEAERAGISNSSRDENQIIQELFERRSANVSVSEKELKAFYQANREMVGKAPFEQVKDGIRQYLLQDKKQQVVKSYISALTDSVHLRVNEGWVESQSRLSLDNPVDKARRSGKSTMVEFGATGCVPCDMMQPILDNLRKNYPKKLNVVFIHVGEEQILAARFGIRSIPVQVFFDVQGKEVYRHTGFFAQNEVTRQLSKMGVKK